jgi:hypothetical protein
LGVATADGKMSRSSARSFMMRYLHGEASILRFAVRKLDEVGRLSGDKVWVTAGKCEWQAW